MWTESESAKKNLRIQNNSDTCGQDLSVPNLGQLSEVVSFREFSILVLNYEKDERDPHMLHLMLFSFSPARGLVSKNVRPLDKHQQLAGGVCQAPS